MKDAAGKKRITGRYKCRVSEVIIGSAGEQKKDTAWSDSNVHMRLREKLHGILASQEGNGHIFAWTLALSFALRNRSIKTLTHFRVCQCQQALSQCSWSFHGWVCGQNAVWDMSRAHSSGKTVQDARCPSVPLLHGYSWRIVSGAYNGSNHWENLTLQDRFNPRPLRLSHYISCWPMLANVAENLPHALNHFCVI